MGGPYQNGTENTKIIGPNISQYAFGYLKWVSGIRVLVYKAIFGLKIHFGQYIGIGNASTSLWAAVTCIWRHMVRKHSAGVGKILGFWWAIETYSLKLTPRFS